MQSLPATTATAAAVRLRCSPPPVAASKDGAAAAAAPTPRQLLARKLAAALQASKDLLVECSALHVPRGLLERAAVALLAVASRNRRGIRGLKVYLYFHAPDGEYCPFIGTVVYDNAVPVSLILVLTLPVQRSTWYAKMPPMLQRLSGGDTFTVGKAFTVKKMPTFYVY